MSKAEVKMENQERVHSGEHWEQAWSWGKVRSERWNGS